MAGKTFNSQLLWNNSRGTVGDWALSTTMVRQPVTQRGADQTTLYNQVYLELECSNHVSNTELTALAIYTKVVRDLFLEWRTACRAFSDGISNGVDDAELKRHLDQLDTVLGLANVVHSPNPAAAIQRVFLAMLRSGTSYYQSLFDDADEDAIVQYARDYLEEGTMFLNEFDRLLRVAGQSFQDLHDRDSTA